MAITKTTNRMPNASAHDGNGADEQRPGRQYLRLHNARGVGIAIGAESAMATAPRDTVCVVVASAGCEAGDGLFVCGASVRGGSSPFGPLRSRGGAHHFLEFTSRAHTRPLALLLAGLALRRDTTHATYTPDRSE